MQTLEYRFFHRRDLPHYQPPGATFFVTFCLTGALPVRVLRELADEAKRVDQEVRTIRDPQERRDRICREHLLQFGRWDSAMHNTRSGPRWLGHPEVAALVCGALHHWDKGRYVLDAFCVMSNHVHMVFTPMKKEDGTWHGLSSIMHSLKLYTARRANHILGRKGQFWHHERYDHVVRSQREWRRIIEYVRGNPVKAGLIERWEDWPWTYCRDNAPGVRQAGK